jgi:hypothetical protein
MTEISDEFGSIIIIISNKIAASERDETLLLYYTFLSISAYKKESNLYLFIFVFIKKKKKNVCKKLICLC